MESMVTTWKWLNDNAGVLGVVLALLPLVSSVMTYLSLKRQELREKRFETYHKLIRQLVQGDSLDSVLSIDRQIAVIFELRNFKEYFPVTKRILLGLKKTWAAKESEYSISRVLEEIDLSLKYIK